MRSPFELLSLLWLGQALLGTACSDGPLERATGVAASAILGGTPSPSPDDDAVVFLRHEALGEEATCSGTLVAPNLVVTARHCVSYMTPDNWPFGCTARGELVGSVDGGGALGRHVPAAAVEIRGGELAGASPMALGKAIISTLSSTSCIDDLAFVVLDRDLDLPIAPVRVGKPTRAGEWVTLVGYGLTTDGTLDWRTQPRQKLLQRIASVGPDSTQGELPATIPRTFEIQGRAGCDGDSGGPALSKTTRAVLGVYSTRVGSCASATVIHAYTNLAPFDALAGEAFRAVGAAPKPEPPRLAFGEPCSEPNECEDGVCAASIGGTTRCSQVCSAAVPCPAGYTCARQDAGEARVCVEEEDAGSNEGDGSTASHEAARDGGCTVVASSARRPGLAAWGVVCLAVLRASRHRAGGARRQRRPSSGSGAADSALPLVRGADALGGPPISG